MHPFFQSHPSLLARARRAAYPGVAAVLACAAACAPVVTHAPRVQPGYQVVVTAGGLRSLCDSGCAGMLTPQVAVGARAGWPAGASTPGYSVGAHAALNLLSSELDVYVQAPRRALPYDAGAGLILSLTHGMPYVQLGRMRADGSGFYTTQGVALHASRALRWDHSHHGPPGEPPPAPDTIPDLLRPRYWAPSVAWRGAGRGAMHVYLSGAFGVADELTGTDGGAHRVTGRRPLRALILGFVVETGA